MVSIPDECPAARLGVFFDRLPGLGDIARGLAEGESPLTLCGLAGSAPSAVVADLLRRLGRPIALIVSDEERATAAYQDLSVLLDPELVHRLPPWDLLPYEEGSPNPEVVAARIVALEAMTQAEPHLFVISLRSLIQLVPPPDSFLASRIAVRCGDEIDVDDLIWRLLYLGYEPRSVVEEPGEMSRRGGLIDLFSFGMDEPMRIEFFGDEVVSLRRFDPFTQRSVGKREEAVILPFRELFFDEKGYRRGVSALARKGVELVAPEDEGPYFEGIERHLVAFHRELVPVLSYLPAEAMLALHGRDALEREAARLAEELFQEAAAPSLDQVTSSRRARISAEEAGASFLDPAAALEGCLAPGIEKGPLPVLILERAAAPDFPSLGSRPQSPYGGSFARFRNDVERLGEEGYAQFLFCESRGQIERLSELLAETDVPLELLLGSLAGGFIVPEAALAVYTDHEIFGRYRRRRALPRERRGIPLEDLLTLTPGDWIVHVDYGIGRYAGLEQIDIDETLTDCLLLRYEGDDKVYVPVERMNLVQRYVGSSDAPPRLSRLGGTAWERAKRRTKRAIREMAKELLGLYAARETCEGHAFPPDTPWQREFESSFIYEETDDQLESTEQIKRDMESARPMDRLVTGDVGYGKTEVALRAAFKAVMDSKQVAILVPTTVLAQQHHNTCLERLAGFPINVEMLSRFRSRKQQKAIIEGLKAGTVDVVVGTHRLLSKDVEFKDLGLVIVDEEQRFGVGHKERLKQLRRTVDVLTMTATPIPRTLHMSLIRIRDLSTIDTPPKNRLSIVTRVVRWDEDLITDALRREVERDGQVFFLHNRVQSIDSVASYLRRIVPEVSFGVAHGQMKEDELEQTMVAFLDRRFQVLVSTSIIESGLDIPNVNTMIVNRADRFGLAQLHQLRGRVGRSDRLAYAYLLVAASGKITRDARKRLAAIESFHELGSGLKLALRDLEIRGAGNILGPEQHGHIGLVGFDLYCRLLDEAVRELKGEAPEEEFEPTVRLGVDAYLPDGYIGDAEHKVAIYRRIASCRSEELVRQIHEELADRFGRLPEPAQMLVEGMVIKLLARRAGIERVTLHPQLAEFEYPRGSEPGRERIAHFMERVSEPVEFAAAGRFVVRVTLDAGPGRLEVVKKVLRILA